MVIQVVRYVPEITNICSRWQSDVPYVVKSKVHTVDSKFVAMYFHVGF